MHVPREPGTLQRWPGEHWVARHGRLSWIAASMTFPVFARRICSVQPQLCSHMGSRLQRRSRAELEALFGS